MASDGAKTWLSQVITVSYFTNKNHCDLIGAGRCRCPRCIAPIAPVLKAALYGVDLGPDDIVLDGDPALPPKGHSSPLFRPMSIVAKQLPISATVVDTF